MNSETMTDNAISEIETLTGEQVDVGLIQSFLQELPEKIFHFGIRVLLAIIVFLIGMQLIKLIRKIVRKSLQRRNSDKGVIQFLDSFIKAILYILLIFMIASGFGLDATGVAAILGSAGVALGLAVQGSLSNFAGGVLILLLKPFKVGDYIKDSAGNEGIVTEIQLFYTKLQTYERNIIIVPNGTLSNSNVTNMNMEAERRVEIKVGISYDADIRTARAALMKLLEQDEKVLQNEVKNVIVTELGDSSVNLLVQCWTRNEDYWATKWRLTEGVKYALDEADISIPYPQLDLHVEKGNSQVTGNSVAKNE